MVPGYWGPPSSTIDWCEENYKVTHFIAEFWNTVSNVAMIIPPFIGAYLLVRNNLERRLIASHLSLMCVGLGSWCFHMTLLYSMQLLDELPMIWGSAVLVYNLATVQLPQKCHNKPLAAILFIYCSVVTLVYILCNIPIFFQISYGILVLSLIGISIKVSLDLKWANKTVLLFGCLAYGLGFVMWNIDNQFCSSLKAMRYHTGFLSPLFEFHAWWHILAGIGTYLGIVFGADARLSVLGYKTKIKFWKRCFPYLVATDPLPH
ncbi:alkaline ceramidase 3-like isoform X2 [Mya arenaria]|uniref:alkaline ceramidase 3-like isoform X2 n=1 Tax=Mya arenaria TaxID=6604 RepID=UPI0022E4B358|nr:alkaline ceramidase 3-like isoform X2 [Mya arenaria]